MIDIVNGIAVMSLAGVLFFFPQYQLFSLIYITFIATLLGITGAIFRPAILACVPDLVPKDKLDSANSLSQAGVQFAAMIGNGVGSVLYRLVGAPLLLFLDSLTYLFSAISEMFINFPDNKKEVKKHSSLKELIQTFKADIKESFQYMSNTPGMLEFLYMAATINFFVIPCTILLPFYIEDYLKLTTDWYGYITIVFGLGAMIGFIVAGTMNINKKSGMLFSLLVTSLMIALMGLTNNAYFSLFIMLTIGTLNGYMGVMIMGIIQTKTISSMRGRIFGLMGIVTGGLTPIGMGLSGVVFDLVDQSIPTIYIGTGVILLCISMVIYFNKNFHAIMEETPSN